MTRLVLYLKTGSVPKDWKSYQVLYANGRPVRDVIEADAFNGWFVQAVRQDGVLVRTASGRLQTRRVVAKIKIEKAP